VVLDGLEDLSAESAFLGGSLLQLIICAMKASNQKRNMILSMRNRTNRQPFKDYVFDYSI